MKQTSRGLAPSLNTGHSTFTSARQRLAVALVAIFIAFAGAQTAGAQTLCKFRFDISGKGTVKLQREGQWLEVTNGEIKDCIIPSVSALTITPETGYYVSSVTYDATDGLSIKLIQYDDFQWSLNIVSYEGSETPTITVHIVFDKGLAGGADEASAVALTADDDLSHLTGGWYKVESDLTFGHTVNLHGDTHITIATGKTLTVSTSDEYGIYGSALTVSGEGTLAVSASNSAIYVDNYTQTGCAVTLSGSSYGLNATNDVSISGGSLTTSGASYGISTDNEAITISGGTVSSSGYQCGLYASDAMNITGGTVSASGNNDGIRGYSVSITGGQVNVSSGGIRSIFGDITLGWTSATDYITASSYQVNGSGTVTIAEGQAFLTDDATPVQIKGTVSELSLIAGKKLTPDLSYAPDITVSYVKADGTTDTHQAKVLTGNETTLDAGWYVVISNITYTGTVSLGDGEVTIILADGKTMTLSSDGDGIRGNNGCTLTIYGQTLGTGTLSATATSEGKAISHNGNVAICGGTVIVNGQWGISAIGTVTINGGTLSATSSTGSYAVYSATGIIINGGQVEATSTYNAICGDLTMTGGNVTANGLWGIIGNLTMTGGNLTATGNDTGIKGNTTLGWTNATDHIHVSSYDGTVTIADGQVFTDGSGHYYSGTLSSDDKTAIAGETLAPAVPYVDADGQTDYCTNFTVLTGSETMLAPGWYVVNSDITYDHNLELSDEGTVNIILCDGATLTANNITPIGHSDHLCIYGQSQGTGTANISGGILATSSLQIYGGTINVTGNIACAQSGVVIYGGNVTAAGIDGFRGLTFTGGTITAGTLQVSENGSIILGGATVTAGSYNVTGNVTILTGITYYDGTGASYTAGNLSADQISAIAGKTLTPAIVLADNADNTSAIATAATLCTGGKTIAVQLSGRTLYKDGYWNTLCLPFAVSTTSEPLSGDNVKAMVLRTSDSGLSGTTLTLNFDNAPATIPAGTPFIIKWDNTGENITNPVFNGVTIDKTNRDVAFTGGWFKGTYEKMAFAEENKSILFVGDDNNLHWPKEGASLGACRAYFELSDVEPGGGGGEAPELRIVLNFGEEEKTGISSLTPDPSPNGEGSEYWYSIDGRKLQCMPTQKGLYIVNGKKVVIK